MNSTPQTTRQGLQGADVDERCARRQDVLLHGQRRDRRRTASRSSRPRRRSGACKILGYTVPIGSQVSVTEAGDAVRRDRGRPAGRERRDEDDHDGLRDQHGHRSRTRPTASSRSARSWPPCRATRPTRTRFYFSVNGSTTLIPVAAGRCSNPIVLPVGTATVKEVAHPDRVPVRLVDRDRPDRGQPGDERHGDERRQPDHRHGAVLRRIRRTAVRRS